MNSMTPYEWPPLARTPSTAELPSECQMKMAVLTPEAPETFSIESCVPSRLMTMLERLRKKSATKKREPTYMKWKYCETSTPIRSKVRTDV